MEAFGFFIKWFIRFFWQNTSPHLTCANIWLTGPSDKVHVSTSSLLRSLKARWSVSGRMTARRPKSWRPTTDCVPASTGIQYLTSFTFFRRYTEIYIGDILQTLPNFCHSTTQCRVISSHLVRELPKVFYPLKLILQFLFGVQSQKIAM